MLKPEIEEGSLVQFEETSNTLEGQKVLDCWRSYYGVKTFFVVYHRLSDHISVFIDGQDKDKVVHFGSSASAFVHVGFFRLRN